MLAKQPNDPFLLYGVALEHKKLNQPAKAIEYLDRVIASDANYCYAYYQRGQILEAMGDAVGAAQSYNDGIAAAKRANDAHAQSELENALAILQQNDG